MKSALIAILIAATGAVPAAAVITTTQTRTSALPGLAGGSSDFNVTFDVHP